MARPKVALISRRRALEVALEMIDRDGLAALSIRGLADKLGVNGASLYHHFANKNEIVMKAVGLALDEVQPPIMDGLGWRQWLLRSVRQTRAVLVAHPAIMEVVIGRRVVLYPPERTESAVKYLVSEGIPSAAVWPLMEALEIFTISSALHESRSDESELHAAVRSTTEYPVLAKVFSERGLSPAEVFDLAVVSIIDAFEEAIRDYQSRWLPTT